MPSANTKSQRLSAQLKAMNLTQLKKVARNNNANKDDEDPIRLSSPKAGLIKQILEFQDRDVADAIEVAQEEKSGKEDEFRRNLKAAFFSIPKVKQEERPYQADLSKKVFQAMTSRTSATVVVATGGGKTKIANDALASHLKQPSHRVLWLSKDWRLLYQAGADFYKRHGRGLKLKPQRFRGDGEVLRFLDTCEGKGRLGRLTYTSIHSFDRNLPFFSTRMPQVSAVVIDEVHWGVKKYNSGTHANNMYGKLFRLCKQHRIPVIGLTATPTEHNDSIIEPEISLGHLIREKYLAEPVLASTIDTGFEWHFKMRDGVITKDSYMALAEEETRNQLIIKTLVDSLAKWGKTLIFAVNIEHCRRLKEGIRQADSTIPVEIVHSQMPFRHQQAIKDKFERGEITVLINVEMMTTGVDVPDIKTVFLTRPTESPILYAQMIGRGSRRIPGKKDRFFIVEFTDSTPKHQDILIQGSRFFRTLNYREPDLASRFRDSVKKRQPSQPFRQAGVFDYQPEEGFENFQMKVGDQSYGLPVNRGQSFGVEIELTINKKVAGKPLSHFLGSGKAWTAVAEELTKVTREILGRNRVVGPHPYRRISMDLDYSKYNVMYDGSCGWEIVTPVLKGKAGLEEIENFYDQLKDKIPADLAINSSTGLHVHFGYSLPHGPELGSLLVNLARIEPYLGLLVSPSRMTDFDPEDNSYALNIANPYADSWATLMYGRKVGDFSEDVDVKALFASMKNDEENPGRYLYANLTNLLEKDGIKTVELRLHNGTLNRRKVLGWISLWMQLLERLKRPSVKLPEVPAWFYEDRAPRPELLKEFDQVFLQALGENQREFVQFLRRRVDEVWASWQGIDREED
ncbi:MAG: helicase-related protein [Bdellovibrionales bacterium]